MISKIFNSRFFYFLFSLLLAFFLFLNANASGLETTGSIKDAGQVYSEILENVPITLVYDSEKYFVSSENNTATVTLTSNNQILLSQEKSIETRKFELKLDLTKMKIGEHQVPISVIELPTSVSAETNPINVNVTIEDKKSKEFTIVPIVDESLIPEGYKYNGVSLDTQKVKVTAGTSSIDNVAEVQAVLPSATDLTKEKTVTVNLVTVNEDGDIVPASLSKTAIKMTILITKETSNSK
ncbi:MAG: CdaR family protein [Lactovum sp.]